MVHDNDGFKTTTAESIHDAFNGARPRGTRAIEKREALVLNSTQARSGCTLEERHRDIIRGQGAVAWCEMPVIERPETARQ